MARIIAIKLSDDLYEKVKQRSLEKGYSFVADYVRSLIISDVRGVVEEKKTLEEMVAEIAENIIKSYLSSKELSSGVEKIVSRLERKIQDMINPWTTKIENLYSRISEVYERIDGLEERIRELENTIRDLKEREKTGRKSYERAGKRKTAIERLREQGVVMESDVYWLRDRAAFFEKLKKEGAIIITTPNERIAVDKEFWISFIEKLEELKSGDEEEVRKNLNETEYKLFEKLRRSGVLWFEAKRSSWVIDLDVIEGI